MLELGRSGAHGVGGGVRPVLSGDDVVATVRASNWKEAASAVVGDRAWLFAKQRGLLTGRWAVDPEHAVRTSARCTSMWRQQWVVDLEGTILQRAHVSWWRRTAEYLLDDREVATGGRTGWDGRPTLDCDQRVPVEHQVFLLWVELVLDRRAAAAA